jgi:hypothetical protein
MLDRRLRQWTRVDDRSRRLGGVTWKHRGQAYAATFTDEPARDDLGMERRIVRITTEVDGRTLSTEIRMQRLAFSNYAQFVDRWDPLVEFHDDELEGRFHSNSEITLNRDGDATPVFNGRVTTAARRVNYADRPGYVRRDRIFRGGLETGIDPIRLPARFVPFPEALTRDDGVRYFAEDARITFAADGTYAWRSLGAEDGEYRAVIASDVSYLVAAAGVELRVAGTVNGKFLVYSPTRIVVEDDVTYAQDPASVPEADDYLGLVSDGEIEVASAAVTGPGDLTIQAALYARRAFVVREYGEESAGTLSIYGSLAAGSLSATEPRYRTRIRFDRRLETLRPPAFPLTDRYEVEAWDGLWKMETTQGL